MDFTAFKTEFDALLKNMAEQLPKKIKADLVAKHSDAPGARKEVIRFYERPDADINLGHFVLEKGGWVRPKYFVGVIKDTRRKVNFYYLVFNTKTGKFVMHSVHTRITYMGSSAERFALAVAKAFAEKHKDLIKDFVMSAPGEINPWHLVS